jgi:hypothetical protein
MEKLEAILGAEHFKKYFKNYNPEDWCEYGLGVMRKTERADLLRIGAIVEASGSDEIVSDGFCVNVFERDEPKNVFIGGGFACEQEMDKIKSARPNTRVMVGKYPKSWLDYYDNKRKYQEALDLEGQNLDEIVKTFA